MGFQEALRSVRRVIGQREPVRPRLRGVLGDGSGNVEVTAGYPYNVYFRRRDSDGAVGNAALEQVQMLRGDIPAIDGMPVVVGEDNVVSGLQVLSRDSESLMDWLFNWILRSHHEQHELYNEVGFDVVWVQSQQFMPLLVYPTDPASMQVNVAEGFYPWADGWNWFPATVSIDLSGYVPTGLPQHVRFVLMSIAGASNALQYTQGNVFPRYLAPVQVTDMIPTAPTGSVPIGAIYLPYGTTSLTFEDRNFYDVRLFSSPVGGSLTPAAHDILSSQHSDTVVDTVVRGDLMAADLSGDWARLPAGTPYQLMTMDITGDDPEWASFDWDNISTATDANMTHDHGSIPQGGDLPLYILVDGTRAFTDYIDMAEHAVPGNPAANTMRLYVEDVAGFSFFSFRDDTGMIRKIVRDSVFVGQNTTGNPIALGRIVYASGSAGGFPTIALARADNANTMPAIGVTIEAIADGAFGRIMQVGLLENVNTNAFNPGDVLYVSAAVAGIPTATPPTYPNIRQEIGTILVQDPAVGSIQIVARSAFNDAVIDHGGLLGLADDDHTIYLLTDGTRAMDSGADLDPTDASGQNLGDATHRWVVYTDHLHFEGATGANAILLVDNLADALTVRDQGDGDLFIRIITTTGSEAIVFNEDGDDIDFRVEGVGQANALFVRGSDGYVGLGTAAPSQQLELTESIELVNTTTATTGVIHKGADRFVHNFQHPTGGGAVPLGYNTFVGVRAGNFTTGSTATSTTHASFLVGIGRDALQANTTGYNNVAIGAFAMDANTTGYANVAIGRDALGANTAGFSNFALGYQALLGNISGDYNVAIGASALRYTTSNENVGLGYQAALSNTTGAYNIGIGVQSLRFNQTGHANIGIGRKALEGTTGNSFSNNIGIGQYVGIALTTGSNNVLIGYQAGHDITTGSANVCIGYLAGDGQITTESNELWIANSATATPLIYGEFDGVGDGVGIRIHSPIAAATAFAVRGAAAQSGNLQELQNSIGTILRASNALGVTGTVPQAITLGVGAVTFAVTSNVMEITGDPGANVIATITGGVNGQPLTLIFVDGLVTITDDNTHAANTCDLSGAFVSADDTVLKLVFHGGSWYEESRSVN